MSDQLIRDYYRCFNERRLADAGALFSDDAVLEMPPFVQDATGADAYAQFADTWLRAFPDAQFRMDRLEQRGDTMCEVDLLATGTHQGLLDLGAWGFLQPSGVRLTLRLRELLEVRDGKIVYATLAFDIDHLVRELSQVDYRKLKACLATVWELSDELAKVQGDVERQREVTDRLGRALDAARHAVRPHVKR
jgi:predicted ester cyclase